MNHSATAPPRVISSSMTVFDIHGHILKVYMWTFNSSAKMCYWLNVNRWEKTSIFNFSLIHSLLEAEFVFPFSKQKLALYMLTRLSVNFLFMTWNLQAKAYFHLTFVSLFIWPVFSQVDPDLNKYNIVFDISSRWFHIFLLRVIV